MSLGTLHTMIAVPFATESETFTFTLVGPGAGTFTATIPAGTWRVNLAPTSGAVRDALRALAAAMNAAPSLPGGTAFSATIDAVTGLVTVTCAGPNTFAMATLQATAMGAALGFTLVSPGAAASQTAMRPPWYVAFLVSTVGGVWAMKRSGARERTEGGAVYSFAGTAASYDRELTSRWIPADPTAAAEADTAATPMLPAPEFMGDLAGTAAPTRAWGLVDVWTAAQNRLCALALCDWQTTRASTGATYWLGYLATDAPVPERFREEWSLWLTLKWTFVLPSTGATGTRA